MQGIGGVCSCTWGRKGTSLVSLCLCSGRWADAGGEHTSIPDPQTRAERMQEWKCYSCPRPAPGTHHVVFLTASVMRQSGARGKEPMKKRRQDSPRTDESTSTVNEASGSVHDTVMSKVGWRRSRGRSFF